ncbi:uncharacterized protein BO66DRAFT_441946 [Aspergillus aculeatinus CBS 121060]|uniref:Uncharacterized protein n=1 Tax=Aspergillus aculeatinus CBS 121060 TaxID=1448322 RepID=A0ACD1GZ39_9EURO|nr:hypothetical protein BO66DRAFT_441946 [Aspergillus aculeatinus CBS 121060]RAH66595.1 hypothetical protein BO66DRAFT_441946 [Aspergillus aculeatinus CBS 121060]
MVRVAASIQRLACACIGTTLTRVRDAAAASAPLPSRTACYVYAGQPGASINDDQHRSGPRGSRGASMLPGPPPPPRGTPRAIPCDQPAPRERANEEEWDASLFVELPPAAWFAGRSGGNTRRGARPPTLDRQLVVRAQLHEGILRPTRCVGTVATLPMSVPTPAELHRILRTGQRIARKKLWHEANYESRVDSNLLNYLQLKQHQGVREDSAPLDVGYRQADQRPEDKTNISAHYHYFRIEWRKIVLQNEWDKSTANATYLKKARDTLLANRSDSLPTVDLYSTIANQSVAPAELLARWKFHDPQTAAVYILSSLDGPIGIVQELPGTGKTFWMVRCLLLFLRNPSRDGKPYQLLVVSTCNDVGRILLSG